MDIRTTEFPVTLQAFEIRDSREEFLAEQVVNTQSEADMFTARFNGKLIKAHALRAEDARRTGQSLPARRSAFPGWALFLLLLIALLVLAYFMGWLQPLIDRIN